MTSAEISENDCVSKKPNRVNKKAVPNSTTIYCEEMAVLQLRHLPLRKIKLATGNSSYHARVFAQLAQRERPERKDEPVFRRKMTTLRKLPTMRPKKRRNMINIVTRFIIKQNPVYQKIDGVLLVKKIYWQNATFPTRTAVPDADAPDESTHHEVAAFVFNGTEIDHEEAAVPAPNVASSAKHTAGKPAIVED